MKVFISVDIEGVVGVLSQFHTAREGDDFAAARLRMTREASAAVAGCLDAGATDVIVNDSHGTMTNLVLEEMHPAARVVYGNTKLGCMVEGLTSDCAAAMYIGYHTPAGVTGQLSHTLAGNLFYAIRMNGQVCGEFDLNAAVAGELGVPSVFITGDDRLEQYIKARYPQVHALAVKEYRGRNCSLASHPSVVQERIRAGAASALAARRKIRPIKVKNPVVEVDFFNEIGADYCATIPGVSKIGDRTVRFKTRTATEAHALLVLMMRVARV
ncbi:MAG: M55 family metallopeptidase [Ignavibacteriales bacterium]|nr:M55 family metallopeptidase [Ignavibacteriales bacterium]